MVDINDIRTIEGNNNQIGDELGNDFDGRTEAPLIRLFDPAFEDGFNEPRGGGLEDGESSLPNPRTVSNELSAQPRNLSGNPLGASDWLWQWGQFLDHDLSLSEGTNILDLPEEEVAELSFNIPLPEGDLLRGDFFTEIPVNRVEEVEGTGVEGEPREVRNEITAFIDGSNGYGSSEIRAAAKRTDLGNSFFGEFTEDNEIIIEESTGRRFVEIEIESEANVELTGVEEEGEEEGEEGEAEGGTETVRLFLPPEGESPFDGKLLVANDGYGTDGLAFEEGEDPNNTSGEILAPYNRADSPNADPDPNGEGRVPNDEEFISGDLRINEQSGLIAIHTLFIREHNLLADKIAFHLDAGDDEALNEAFEAYSENASEIHEDASDEQIRGEFIYEAARAVVGAKNQVITYEEFLPILVGNETAADLEVIDEDILSPGIAVEFSGAAYRLGHTLLSDQIFTVDRRGTGNISLQNAFFNPQSISENGLDDILVGLNYQESNEADTRVIDGVRNNLFGPEGRGGLDLVAINLQRGRELGIPGYTEVYNQLNPDAPIEDFDDLGEVFGEDLAASFAEVYDSVDQIDLWIGGLAEMPINEDVLLGPTLGAIVSDQFARLRDYDRFFYEDQLAEEDSFLSVVSNAIDLDLSEVRLAGVIRENVDTPELVPDNAFAVPFENERLGTVNADNGNNRIVGSSEADLIDGDAGDDDIRGSLGDDIIFGGAGSDSLFGQGGADTLIGGFGNDLLEGQAGDVFIGGTNDDTYDILVSEPTGTYVVDETGNNDVINLNIDRQGGTLDLELTDFEPGVAGIKKSGNDLLIDLNQDGIIDPEADLTIGDYFNNVGEARASTIEQVGNLDSEEIIEYFNTPEITEPSRVFRFFNEEESLYRYTTDIAERNVLRNDEDLRFNGTIFFSAPEGDDLDALTGAKPVYSFTNEDTGTQLFTISEFERDVVLENSSILDYEGVAFYAYTTQVEGTQPVYRFLNTENGTHVFTPSAGERTSFIENEDFAPEGLNGGNVAFYVPEVEI